MRDSESSPAPRPANRAPDLAEPVVLIMADISGYTRYMTANAKTLAHSQTVITELVTAIVQEVELPLTVAKLEGDAVFMFCRKNAFRVHWEAMRESLGRKLIRFFELFNAKAEELSRSVTCTCSACTHIEKLRLKLIVHSGQALFHRIVNFDELAGVDVILLHRLLKNSVQADQYLLVTEAGSNDVKLPETFHATSGLEEYEDFGPVKTLVYLPGGIAQKVLPAMPSFPVRARQSARLFSALWFSPFSATNSKRSFHHVETESTKAGRAGFKFLTLLLTPIMLPVGILFAFLRASGKPQALPSAAHDHVHRPDGNCCRHDQP